MHNGRQIYRVVGHLDESDRDSIKRLLSRGDGLPVYAQYDNGSIDIIEPAPSEAFTPFNAAVRL